MSIAFKGMERVTHDESRIREAQYWAERGIAERVIAGWALAENNLLLRDQNEPEKRTGITLRRIPRSRG